jgi:hypothetical protein
VSILGQDGHVYKGRLNSRLAIEINKHPVIKTMGGQRLPNAYSLDNLALHRTNMNPNGSPAETSSVVNEDLERKPTHLPSLNSNL